MRSVFGVHRRCRSAVVRCRVLRRADRGVGSPLQAVWREQQVWSSPTWGAPRAIPARDCATKCARCCWIWVRAAIYRCRCSAATSPRRWRGYRGSAPQSRILVAGIAGCFPATPAPRRPDGGGCALRALHADQRCVSKLWRRRLRIGRAVCEANPAALGRQGREAGHYLRAVPGQRQPLLGPRRDLAGR